MQNQFFVQDKSSETISCIVPKVTPETTETTETTSSTQTIAQILEQAQRALRRRKRRYRAGFAALGTAGWLPLLIAILLHNPVYSAFLISLKFLSLSLIWAGFGGFLLTTCLTAKPDLEPLRELGGTQAIPTLLASLTGYVGSAHFQATLRTLIGLLPQMRTSDASLLTRSNRQTLNTWLSMAFQPMWIRGAGMDFVLAILKVYEQVGDATAIPFVERLTKREPRNERERKIRQAAEECLPLLRAHVSEINVTQTLLRPSMPETNTPDNLLRPATATLNTSSEEMLRAANSQDRPPSV